MGARRSWTVGVCMVLAAFAGGFAAQVLVGGRAVHAQEAAADELRVQLLVFVDKQGLERAVLGLEEDGSIALALTDSSGRERIRLGGPRLLGPEPDAYWALACLDENGVDRIGWGVRDDGEGCGGHSTDSEGVVRIGVGAATSGIGVTLNDESDQQRLGFGLGAGGAGDFVAKDEFGNDMWRALGDIEAPALP